MPLSLKKNRNLFHFCINNVDVQEAMNGYCTKNTMATNKWILRNLTKWVDAHNSMVHVEEKNIRQDLLMSDDANQLCE